MDLPLIIAHQVAHTECYNKKPRDIDIPAVEDTIADAIRNATGDEYGVTLSVRGTELDVSLAPVNPAKTIDQTLRVGPRTPIDTINNFDHDE